MAGRVGRLSVRRRLKIEFGHARGEIQAEPGEWGAIITEGSATPAATQGHGPRVRPTSKPSSSQDQERFRTLYSQRHQRIGANQPRFSGAEALAFSQGRQERETTRW